MKNHENSSEGRKSGFIAFMKDPLLPENGSTFLPPFSLDGWIFFLAGAIGSLILGWIIYPVVLYSSQPQPFNFNHSIHMDAVDGDTEKEKCFYCHEFRDDGTFAGIPRLERCMDCHDDPDSPMGQSETEKEFLANYVAKEKEIPWLSYSRQPDCVYFSHVSHVQMGNLECGVCHGDHGQSEKLPLYQKNRLTGYSINIWGKNIAGYKTNSWDRMKMDDCAECHTKMGQEKDNACFVCHK